MRRVVTSWSLCLVAVAGLTACGGGLNAGEACATSDACAGELRCIEFVCTDLALMDTEPADVTGDVDPWEGKSYYTMKIKTELGQEYDFVRDITEKPNAFSFGSTHIAPAVSFAISEDLTFPATMTLTLNFGIVFGSDRFPIQCDGPKTYLFSSDPPEVDVTIGLRYRSTVPGASGSVIVTEWANQTGGIMRGTYKGRLLQKTDLPAKRWADVEGEFQFTLPEKEQGQPK
jgi:hypothetical protein